MKKRRSKSTGSSGLRLLFHVSSQLPANAARGCQLGEMKPNPHGGTVSPYPPRRFRDLRCSAVADAPSLARGLPKPVPTGFRGSNRSRWGVEFLASRPPPKAFSHISGTGVSGAVLDCVTPLPVHTQNRSPKTRATLHRPDFDADVDLRRSGVGRLRMPDQDDIGVQFAQRNLGFVLVAEDRRRGPRLAGEIDGHLFVGERHQTFKSKR